MRPATVVPPIPDPVAVTLDPARWQLLHQPGFPNVENMALRPNAVTLSRTDLIAFRGERP